MVIDRAKTAKTIEWLIAGAPSERARSHLFAELCEQLTDAGFALTRVNMFIQTLHPDVFGISMVWRPDAEMAINMASFDTNDSDAYHASPLAVVYESGQELRLKLDDPLHARFPIVSELIAAGATDYILLPMFFSDGAMQILIATRSMPKYFKSSDKCD